MLILRGHGIMKAWQELAYDGGHRIKVPGSTEYVNLVSSYKHLGCEVYTSGSNMLFAKSRASKALSANVPIATRLFGSPWVSTSVKRSFQNSLCNSRLFFNAHVRVLTPKELRILNSSYMKVLRRIAGMVRFNGSQPADVVVRELMNAPSVDCIIMKMRLQYLRRLLCSQCAPLTALLSAKDTYGVSASPLAKLIAEDLDFVYNSSALARDSLCAPTTSPEAWKRFIVESSSAWDGIIDQTFFSESSCDRTANAKTPSAACSLKCTVPGCMQMFPCTKSLMSHLRAKHKQRTGMRFFASSDGVCQACLTSFSCRTRLICHLTDARRPKCRNWLEQHGVPLSSCIVQALDGRDRALRKEARRLGHTQPLSRGPAKLANGKLQGRAGC